MLNGRLPTIAIVTALAAALLALAGCGGSGDAATEAAETATEATSAPEPTTTEETEVTPPVTDAERAWLKAVKRYQARFQRETHRNITITNAAMQRRAKLYGDCAKTLREAGDPGRFEPAAARAERACKRLTRAQGMLGKAIAASDESGAVIAGSAEAAIFDRALDGSFEAAGNAEYDLQLAIERAESIERRIARAA